MSIKDIFDKLPDEKRAVLMHAFNNELPQFVKLDNGGFIGVNVKGQYPNLKIEQEAGAWSTGKINGGS